MSAAAALTPRGRLLATGLLVGAALFGAAPAWASSGVSIDVARIAVSQDLAGGDDYRLPTFGVRNPGTEPTTYALTVSYVDGEAGMRPPAEWFDFSPPTMTLAGGASGPVQTRLRIPADAEPGTYSALIGPQITTDQPGAQIGAGAAAKLTFTVAPSSWWDAWLRIVGRWLGQNPGVGAVAGAIALLIAIRILRRRVSITVARRA